MDAWISMSNEFNIFLPDNPSRKVELAEPQYIMENSSRALLLSSFGSEELLPRMVHGNWKKDVHEPRGLSQRLLIS